MACTPVDDTVTSGASGPASESPALFLPGIN